MERGVRLVRGVKLESHTEKGRVERGVVLGVELERGGVREAALEGRSWRGRVHTSGTQTLLGTIVQTGLGTQVKEAKFSIPSEEKQQPFSSLTVYNALGVGLGASVSPSNVTPFLQAVLGTESRLRHPTVLSVKLWASSFTIWDRDGVGNLTPGCLSSLF